MIGTVVSQRCAIGRDRGAGFAYDHRAVHKRQVVVTVCAAGRRGVSACVLFCASGTHAGQHAGRFAAHQAGGHEATGGLVGTVVGQRRAVGGDCGAGLADHHRAINKRQVVVSVGAAGSGRVGSCVFLSPRGGNACQHRYAFAAHQAGSAKTTGGLVGAVVGQVRTVGSYRGAGFAYDHRTINKRQVVVGVRAAGSRCVSACVLFCARGAHAGQHAGRFAAHQAGGGEAAGGLVGAVVSQRCTIGCDRGIGFANHHGAVYKRQVVVGVRAAGCRCVSACVFLSPRGGNACQHRYAFAAHQAGSAKTTGGLVGAVVGQVRTVGSYRGAGFAYDHRTINKRQVVVGVRAAGSRCVSACVLFCARGAHAGQHAGRFAAHQAGGGEAAGGLVGAVVGQRCAVGRYRGVGSGNDQTAVDGAHGVVGLCACGHGVGVTARVLRAST